MVDLKTYQDTGIAFPSFNRPWFRPNLTPKDILELGVLEGYESFNNLRGTNWGPEMEALVNTYATRKRDITHNRFGISAPNSYPRQMSQRVWLKWYTGFYYGVTTHEDIAQAEKWRTLMEAYHKFLVNLKAQTPNTSYETLLETVKPLIGQSMIQLGFNPYVDFNTREFYP